jgi:hypothetical protein
MMNSGRVTTILGVFMEIYTRAFHINHLHPGWQLGTEPEVQVATVFSNHLTNAIMRYFSDSGRLSEAADFFKLLIDKDPEVAAVLARSYLGTDEEVKAVDIMFSSLTKSTISYGTLLVQIDFLRAKVGVSLFLQLKTVGLICLPI